MQVEVDTKYMQTNFGGRGYASFRDIGPFVFFQICIIFSILLVLCVSVCDC